MADVVASDVLNSLLDRLRDRITNEFGQLMDVGTELKKLAGTLSAIRDVLEDAEGRQVQERALRGWLRRLKDVAYDIDDLLDEDLAKNRKRSLTDPESSTTSWMMGTVSNLLSLPSSIISQLKIGREIREIRERLDELAEERSKFHLQERSVVTCCRQENVGREETSSFVIESEFYGRDEDKKKIIKFLVDTSGGDLGIIAIVGMGGLGKTTLAQIVYNDQQISDHFEKRIWVCVSDDFDHKRLVRSIIEHTTGKACDLTSMAAMQSKLKQELEKKRFLLVLDDVWNENYEKWDIFRTLLTIGATASKVIVTTRSVKIASLMATVDPHFLKTLSEDDCWLLFERRAFGIGASVKTANLVTIGKEIVKKCGGVPLAAKVLGSLMRSKRRESEWLAVRDNESWKLEENGILPALRLSYNHLPSHLKQCFAYCSIFPKDTVIIAKDLIQLWIAEGFVRSLTESVELEDVGYQYIEELLSKSLFEEPRHMIGAVVIHDLVHNLAQFVSGEECSSIVKAVNKRDIYPVTRYSSFIYSIEIIPSVLEILNKAKKLRTLYFLKSHPFVQIGRADMMQKILQTVFSSMKLLRALYLKYYPIKELPNSISNLRHLRYLNLSSTNLETLPQSIGFLHNLQVLSLQGCRFLKELPDSIGNLSNILTLNLEYCTSFISLPASIGHLKSLQTLNLAYTRIKKLPESVRCLSNLRSINLTGCFFVRELPENKENAEGLTCFHTGHCHKLTRMPAGLTQPSYFRELLLFDLCEKSECGLKELSRLNHQGILLITGLENVKNFQQAREANLIEMDGLNILSLTWELGTYKKHMEACMHTDVEGRSRQGLINALTVAEEVLDGLKPHENLTILRIFRYPGKIFPKWLESSLPNLVHLYVFSCFRCETLPRISQLHNLEILYLEKLPAVKSLPPLGQLPALKVLHLVALLAVKSLGSEFYGTGDGAFPVLEKLRLEHMPELEEWCAASAAQQRSFPRLSELMLLDCPKLKELPSSFPSVEQLYLCANSELLLSSLPRGAFPSLKIVHLANSYDPARPSVPRFLVERLTYVKCLDFHWWDPMDDDDLDFIRCISELP
ncbi:putative disease resistance protein RGA3 [Ananas comosus]|uniref:Disease resistance protein RGA3 n=1 Tax=Ananas comosus TaxID=4615 RepID=A0A6P5ESR7_ANACO|nr:putative disease resistance protein RGA3 [Ananas comosus]